MSEHTPTPWPYLPGYSGIEPDDSMDWDRPQPDGAALALAEAA